MKKNKRNIPTPNSLFLNVPLTLIKTRWFKDEVAVRVWFFYAWNALQSKWEKNQTKVVKGQTFHLQQGETICTRSYLAKSLNCNDNSAKSCTDKLKRTNHISVSREILKKWSKAYKRTVSKVKVSGVPIPDETYASMALPEGVSFMWKQRGLAQLYIYLLCSANKKTYVHIGNVKDAVHVRPGELIIRYNEIKERLNCKGNNLANNLKYLEALGLITRKKIGNTGLLIHLNHYKLPSSSAQKQQTIVSVQGKPNNQAYEATKAPAQSKKWEDDVELPEGTRLTSITIPVAKWYLWRDGGVKNVKRLNILIDGLVKIVDKNKIYLRFLEPALRDYYYNFDGEYPSPKHIGKVINSFLQSHQFTPQQNEIDEFWRQVNCDSAENLPMFVQSAFSFECLMEEYNKEGVLSSIVTEDNMKYIISFMCHIGLKNNITNSLYKEVGRVIRNNRQLCNVDDPSIWGEVLQKRIADDRKSRPDWYEQKHKNVAVVIEALFESTKNWHKFFCCSLKGYEECYNKNNQQQTNGQERSKESR